MKKVFTQDIDRQPVEFTVTIVERMETMLRSQHPDFEPWPPRQVQKFDVTGTFHIHAPFNRSSMGGEILRRTYDSKDQVLKFITTFEDDLMNTATQVLRSVKEKSFEEKMNNLGYK